MSTIINIVSLQCEHCREIHWYEPSEVAISNNALQYSCHVFGAAGLEKNDPEVIAWLQQCGVPMITTTPFPAVTASRHPGPSRREDRGNHFPEGKSSTGGYSAWPLVHLPPAITILFVLAVATGLVPRVLVMALGLPIALWFSLWASRRWL